MLRATVLSEPGSGGSTFFGLLYATLVRAATGTQDDFRFTTAPDSLAVLTRMYTELMSGEFPPPPSPEHIAAARLVLAYRRRTGLMRLRPKFDYESAPKIEVRWMRSGFLELGEALSGGISTGPTVSGVVETAVPIFVLPAPGTGAGSPPTGDPGSTRDESVRAVLSALQGGGASHLHPVFVFTHFDRLSDQDRQRWGLHPSVDSDEAGRERPLLEPRAVQEALPRTLEYCAAHGRRVDAPRSFFSMVRTVGNNARRIALQANADQRQDPVYSTGQYRALVEYLGTFAN